MLAKILAICALAAPSAALTITRNGGQSCYASGTSCYAGQYGSLGPVTMSYNLGAGSVSLNAAGYGSYTMTIGGSGSYWTGVLSLKGSNWQNFRTETLQVTGSSGGTSIRHNNVHSCTLTGSPQCCYLSPVGGNAGAKVCWYPGSPGYFTLDAPSVSMSYTATEYNGQTHFTVTPGKFSSESISISTPMDGAQVAKPQTNSSSSCCWCNGKCCNPSPFAGDDRCVCGTAASDWKTPAQCGAAPSPGGSCNVAVRSDCGYTGINQGQCEAKGCCWAPGNGPWCFYKGSKDIMI